MNCKENIWAGLPTVGQASPYFIPQFTFSCNSHVPDPGLIMFLIQKSKLQISSDPIVMICAALCITAVYTATATWMFLGVTGLSAIGYFGWKDYNQRMLESHNPKHLAIQTGNRAGRVQISYGQMMLLAWVTTICLAYYFIFHCEFSIFLSNSRISNRGSYDDYDGQDVDVNFEDL